MEAPDPTPAGRGPSFFCRAQIRRPSVPRSGKPQRSRRRALSYRALSRPPDIDRRATPIGVVSVVFGGMAPEGVDVGLAQLVERELVLLAQAVDGDARDLQSTRAFAHIE